MGNEITGNAFREWVHSLPDARNHYRERGEIAEIMLRNREEGQGKRFGTRGTGYL
jgi:hypothetical protein